MWKSAQQHTHQTCTGVARTLRHVPHTAQPALAHGHRLTGSLPHRPLPTARMRPTRHAIPNHQLDPSVDTPTDVE